MKCGIFILTVLFLHSFQVSDGLFGKKCGPRGPHGPHAPGNHQGPHHGGGGGSPSHPPSENDALQGSGSGSGSDGSSSNEGPKSPWDEIQYSPKPSNIWLSCCGGGHPKKPKPKPVKNPDDHGKGPRCRNRFWAPTPPPEWGVPSTNEIF